MDVEVRRGDEKLRGFASQANDALSRLNQEDISAELKTIRSTLTESANISTELTKQLEDIRKQLDEQRMRSPMDVAKETFERQKKQFDSKNDRETLQRSQDARVKLRKEGTCSWIFDETKTPEYKEWFDSSQSEMVLMTGGANMGKSVLVSTVIETLQQYTATQGNALIIYFFCRRGENDAQQTDRIFQQVCTVVYMNALVRIQSVCTGLYIRLATISFTPYFTIQSDVIPCVILYIDY